MVRVDAALPSPRIVNGIIMWYEGDSFEISLKLSLKDADGNNHMLSAGDRAFVEIKNDKMKTVKEFVFSNVNENILSMTFDRETSAMFPVGKYFYDVRLEGAYNTTVAKNNRIKVE